MKQAQDAVEEVKIEEGSWKRVLRHEDAPVLTLSLRYPKLPESPPGLRRVGRYYRQVAEQWKSRWEGALYSQAKESAQARKEASLPFRPWEASLTYTVTLQQNGLLSLYLDACEDTGGPHPLTVRQGDTWELPAGAPRSLRSFFPPRRRWRQEVFSSIQAQIQARIRGGESLFYDGWESRMEQEFDPDRFYLTPEGASVFFPLYTIAPYAEGIPVFQLPLPAAETT